jgi:hypothetical protein
MKYLIDILSATFVIGVPVSLPAMLPFLRKRAQHRTWIKRTQILVFSLLSFVAVYVTFSFLSAWESVWQFERQVCQEIGYESATCGILLRYRDYIVQELWTRTMIPPTLHTSCYANTYSELICRSADDIAQRNKLALGWQSYLFLIGKCLGSALMTCILVSLFVRKEQTAKSTRILIGLLVLMWIVMSLLLGRKLLLMEQEIRGYQITSLQSVIVAHKD